MVRLVLFQNDQRLGLELKDGVYRLGREKPADVVIPDGTISANHAELQVEGTTCRLRDLGSRNGTFVNGEQIRVSTVVQPGDELHLGTVKMTIEYPEEVRAAAPVSAPRIQPKVQIQAARNKANALAWSLKAWFAGAEAILFLLMLFLLTQLYSNSVAVEGRSRMHYQSLASQYWQVLKATQDGDIPPPVHDDSLREPVMVANAEGKILYPKSVTLPDGTVQPVKSPLINPKTNRVFNDLKSGTYDLTVPGTGSEGPIRVKSYPIRAGGNLLGFVMARPGEEASSPLPFILTLLFVSAAISLLVLYFAMRPVVSAVNSQISAIRTRVSPLLNGFVDSLPVSPNVPELNELAGELEKSARAVLAGAVGRDPKGGKKGSSEFDRFVADLADSARVPYCFVSADYKVLDMNDDFRNFSEFTGAAAGTSIFDGGLTSIQSKQLVQAITNSRKEQVGIAPLTLTEGRNATAFRAVVRSFTDQKNNTQVFGIMIQREPASEG